MGKRLFGSFQNRLMENCSGQPAPVVGMGATLIMYSDRHAYTIVEVDKSGKKFFMTRDTPVKAENYDYFGNQNYSHFVNNMDSPHRTEVRMNKTGQWKEVNSTCKERKDGTVYWGTTIQGTSGVMVGHREEHQDPHF